MAALPQNNNWTVQAYFDYEQETDQRHEFVDGQIFAMAGASERHNQLTSAMNYMLYGQVLDRDCQVFQSDMRVKANESIFLYPDIVVVCGDAHYLDDTRNTLLNPTVVAEVLSPSTEDYDRGRKFKYYREITSLQEYLLVAQNQMQVEHYTRQSPDTWLLTVYSQADSVLSLPSIDCTVALSELYRKVAFD